MACAREGCDHKGERVLFKSVCHPEAGYWASYGRDEKTLVLFCSVCRKGIAEIAVAAEVAEPAPLPPLEVGPYKPLLKLVPTTGQKRKVKR